MRKLKNIISGFIWAVISLYLLIIVLIHIPAIQTIICKQISNTLSNKLGTEIKVGKVDIGMLNRIIIDDFTLKDQANLDLIKATRLSAKFEYIPLITHGKIYISSVQLMGLKTHIYKKTESDPYNFQFALDSLASNDTTTKTPLDIKINSLIIRRGEVKYDRWDIPHKKQRFSPHHIHINNLSAHIIVNALKNDSANIHLKNVSLNEQSGFSIKSLSFKMTANKKQALLSSFLLLLPKTKLQIENVKANYTFEANKLLLPSLDFAGNITESHITLHDLSCFIPSFKKSTKTLYIGANFAGTSTSLRLNTLSIQSPQSHIRLLAEGSLSQWQTTPKWIVNIKELLMSAEGIRFIANNFGTHLNIPPHIVRLGKISYKGEIGGYGSNISLRGAINTDVGNANIIIKKQNKNFSSRLETQGFDLKKVLANEHFGTISTQISLNGVIPNNKQIHIKAKGKISQFQYNNYTYKNIDLDGTLYNSKFDGLVAIIDPNINMKMKGELNLSPQDPYANLTLEVDQLKPTALKLTNNWNNASFSFNMEANIKGKNINTANGNVQLKNFAMISPNNNYSFNKLQITAYNHKGIHQLNIDSDFASLQLNGKYDYNTLPQSIINFIGDKLPTLPGLPKTTFQQTNNFTINATLVQTEWLQKIFNIPLNIHLPATLKGGVNDHNKTLDMTLQLPEFEYDGKKFESAFLNITTPNDTLHMEANVNRIERNNKKFNWNLKAKAHNNQIVSHITFDNMRKQQLKGDILSIAQFYKDDFNKSTANVQINPSKILIGETQWNIQPSQLIYSKNNLSINNFAITNNDQHIAIEGKASTNPEDSIAINLKDINVAYILNLINFQAVDFGGLASGTAVIKTPFNKLEAYSNLHVKDFEFEKGKMGDLKAFVVLNNKDKQIDIQAIAKDDKSSITTINGNVSPQRNDIELFINADNTNIAFIESFCGSFMKDVKATATGDIRLFGPLNKINLEGYLTADGTISISSLNTTYTLRNKPIQIIPDNIIFKNDTIYDINGNIGIINGNVYHQHLTNLSYDLHIDAKKLLAYDFKTFGDNTFYGTVKATGTCDIKGKSGEVNIDVDATPEEGTTFVYNVTSPDAVNNTQFIQWGQKALRISPNNTNPSFLSNKENQDENNKMDIPTDIRINFLINTNPKATLKLIMDKESGDHILLNGNGGIRASYYNKGSFDMYGNYQVEEGVYKLTIQNVIKKDFHFQRGGIIAFGGNPYQALLNLKAIYTANSVSLADLNLGESFSNNNIKVNCIMNISGTPERPSITFDLDMPTVNSNAKQMIYSLINGEEEMNQQVIYLLAVGRFFTQNNNNSDFNTASSTQSETSLAMQSLLSGTLSQQLNNVLSNIINNTNWNFGANISTGTEGWENAEYEGLLSGRLLNNRLLFNGEFGYRDNPNAATNFIGDFDIRYLLLSNGNLAVRMYNQTNDRYFTKNSMTTQGLGLIMKKDFNGWKDLLGLSRKKKNKKNKSEKATEFKQNN